MSSVGTHSVTYVFVNDGDVEQTTTLRETIPRTTEPSVLGFLMRHLDSVKMDHRYSAQ